MKIEFKNEYELTEEEILQLKHLFKQCFTKNYVDREYFKQIPHHRLLAKEEEKIIGQLGIDHRIMSLNSIPIRVWGIIDVCVSPKKQGLQIASKLLEKAEEIALSNNLDFMLLFADNPNLYLKNGYRKCTNNEIIWTKLNEHKTLGIGMKTLPELMVKELKSTKWGPGTLDMMGYLY